MVELVLTLNFSALAWSRERCPPSCLLTICIKAKDLATWSGKQEKWTCLSPTSTLKKNRPCASPGQHRRAGPGFRGLQVSCPRRHEHGKAGSASYLLFSGMRKRCCPRLLCTLPPTAGKRAVPGVKKLGGMEPYTSRQYNRAGVDDGALISQL